MTVAKVHHHIRSLAYEVLGMKDLWLDWAGRQPPSSPVHRALCSLQADDRVTLEKNTNGRVPVVDSQRRRVALLSEAGSERWSQYRNREIDEVRVLGMVHRTKDDTDDPVFRERLRVESWEVPILEVRTRQDGKRKAKPDRRSSAV